MRPTEAPPLRTRNILSDAEILPALNLEILPALRFARDALNGTFTTAAKLKTAATATFTSIWTSDIVTDQRAWFVEAQILARGGAGARSVFIIRGTFTREGALAQEGATVAEYTQTVAAFAVQFSVSGNRLSVQVQDDGIMTVSWLAVIKLVEVPL